MPSRDYDPPHDEQRPEGRWGEPPRDAHWRESERRHDRGPGFDGRDRPPEAPAASTFTQQADVPARGSAFPAAPREPRSPAGPGTSYGGSGGRASGSQAYGYEPSPEPGRQMRAGADSAEFSQSVYDQNQARQRHPSGDWDRPLQEGRPGSGAPTQGLRGRGFSPYADPGPEHRLSQRQGRDRQDDTQFDADYRQWRDEQMRMLDREYAQWRKERYRKFAEEFSQWRMQRLQPQPAAPVPPRQDDTNADSLGDLSALGAAGAGPLPGNDREPREPREPERPGGLLSSLLGGHGERHKPKP